jgi:predicted O-linked N-acetylglucosamine transferase (SPINDLY family)
MKFDRQAKSAQALFERALSCHRGGDVAQARELYSRTLKSYPQHVEALHMAGILMAQQADFAAAAALVIEAVRLQPGHVNAHNNLGNILQKVGDLDGALCHYQRAIELNPQFADAFNNRGVVLKEQQRYGAAAESFKTALALKPNYPAACSNLGLTLDELGELDQALLNHDKAIALEPQNFQAHYNRGKVLLKLKDFTQALVSNEAALALSPGFVDALHNRALALEGLEREDEAMASFEQVLALSPDRASAHFGKARLAKERGDMAAALQGYQRALEIQPNYPQAWCNMGSLLHAEKQHDAALFAFNQALALKPDYQEAYSQRGLLHQEANALKLALDDYERALSLNPDCVEICNNQGVVLQSMGRLAPAQASLSKAVELDASYVPARINLGNLLVELGKPADALLHYTHALLLKPDYPYLEGLQIHSQMKTCDWTGIDKKIAAALARLEAGEKSCPPFAVLAISDAMDLQRKAAAIWLKDATAKCTTLPAIAPHAHDKIRIGYFSADFHDHATAFLMAELFELHDKSRFEIIAFSFGPDRQDTMRRRLVAAFDQFLDVREETPEAIVRLARRLEIDIAIDLKGCTQGCRPAIFAMRAAPVQINYLGYPGSMGVDFMDYLIADRVLIPESSQHLYSEKILYMPGSYQVNDAKRVISDRVFTRAEVGLPDTGFVYCCFNNNYKITPATFNVWMRILKGVEGSVLWLLADSPAVIANLSKEAELRGVSASRLVFAPRMALDEHLARHRLADLFLDTLPCNAHTTASDALWVGLPVLTCAGESFAGRVAASLLNAVGLSELIMASQADYCAQAVKLGQQPWQLASLKSKLESHLCAATLFDTRRYTGHLEQLYLTVQDRCCVRLPLEDLA